MAVLQGILESMALTRSKYLDKWDGAKNPIIEHIIKLALIIDDSNQNKWKGEIDAQLVRLSTYDIKSKLSYETFNDEIYEDYRFENQAYIDTAIIRVVDEYCSDTINKTETAYVREWESRLAWVESKINAIFKRCVDLVCDSVLKVKIYKKGDVGKDPTIKAVLDEFHAIKEYKVWKHEQVIRESN